MLIKKSPHWSQESKRSERRIDESKFSGPEKEAAV
jgi:hypothetical protein